ncbi:5,10-methylene tetrahydromethanopterin reductase [Xylanimonas allomyrinae]|uniref:5,10-methylene tetrahydromethanopterin reductase n=1 Tax=Xylanimonas allomyrinae TaxID=2509459 RepID=A0A4P6EJ53_9MICO|nr:5,10-methylene tetrahydromethanopterin reductase [Xylanimonas allomyrinae]QAY62562.1 5,10-methylene tetrahydromethanopterin reductase [Xylanimonas allomyrinae]
MTEISLLCPHQPSDAAMVRQYARVVREGDYARLWTGQSFMLESHMALATLGGTEDAVPVGIGTALAPLRTPYDAALQARSLALALDRPVSVAYGAADPDFVRAVRGEPLRRPASFVSAYARTVRSLLDGELVTSEEPGTETRAAQLPDVPRPVVEVGTGVLRPSMAAKSANADFVVTWLTPRNYVRDVLLPRLTRPDGGRPRVVTNVHIGLERPGRNANFLAQTGCFRHLGRPHYVDMLQRAGLDVHPSDIVSSARELVRKDVFVYGDVESIAEHLADIGRCGVDEIVLNLTAVAFVHGDAAAIDDLHTLAEHLATRKVS